MPVRSSYGCTLSFTFKNPFHKASEVESFKKEFQKYTIAEAKKVKGLKIRWKDSLNPNIFRLSSGDRMISLRISNKIMGIAVSAPSTEEDFASVDSLINSMMSYLDLSQPSIKSKEVTFTTSLDLASNPSDRFYDKSAIAGFNSKSKVQFSPGGIVFESVTKNHMTMFIVSSPSSDKKKGGRLLILDGAKDLSELPFDAVQTGRKTINDIKNQILAALGVSPK